MAFKRQAGYMDAQMTPAMIGLVLLYVLVGQIESPEFDLDKDLIKFSVFLFLATAALLYGFVMHLYALGYPESPFNKHSSAIFMTLLCAGPLAYMAYRFYSLDMQTGFMLYGILSVLVVACSIGFGIYRNNKQ